MLHRVALVRADVSEEFSASFIGVTRIGELRTTLAVTSNRSTLRRNTKQMCFSTYLTTHSKHKCPVLGLQITNWWDEKKQQQSIHMSVWWGVNDSQVTF
jgi:hypothetical protein